ncbi:MAG: hypothetical protein M9905_03445 [Rhizobiaceae bacterium]|nr:hypothetical protein [Rhizobiaceae bacterium]
MSNIFTLHTDKRWKAVIEYRGDGETQIVEHYFEEISELHLIIERGPEWNRLVCCTVTLNRDDSDEENDDTRMVSPKKRPH